MHRSRAGAAEPGEAAPHVENERLARLLAVVDHVEPGLDLPSHDVAHGSAAQRLDRALIHGFADGAPREEGGQLCGTGQAARVRRQDAMFAALHVLVPILSC